jgi:pimeloyl-ACP methyl ester carboxylesterase
MPTITTKDGAAIFYKDWGTGRPVVFSHGWPLIADAWDPGPLGKSSPQVMPDGVASEIITW